MRICACVSARACVCLVLFFFQVHMRFFSWSQSIMAHWGRRLDFMQGNSGENVRIHTMAMYTCADKILPLLRNGLSIMISWLFKYVYTWLTTLFLNANKRIFGATFYCRWTIRLQSECHKLLIILKYTVNETNQIEWEHTGTLYLYGSLAHWWWHNLTLTKMKKKIKTNKPKPNSTADFFLPLLSRNYNIIIS